MTQHHFLYYSMNILSCRDDSGAEMLAELWENEGDKGPIRGLFHRDAHSLAKSFYLSDTQCLSHAFSLPIMWNWERLYVRNYTNCERGKKGKEKIHEPNSRRDLSTSASSPHHTTNTCLLTHVKWTSVTGIKQVITVKMEGLKDKNQTCNSTITTIACKLAQN